METSDQREHRSATEEQAELVQAQWNHQESACTAQHLAPSVKVCGPSVVLLLISSVSESLLTAFSLSLSRSTEFQDPAVKGKIILPAIKLNHFMNHTTSYSIKNPTGELFTYTPSGKVMSSSSAK